MKILIDTQEQKELEFNHPYITEIVEEKLDVGDYWAEFSDGYRPPIIFERKSIGDLFGTLGKGYDRFKKEIVRSLISKVQLYIIIEGTLSRVLKGYEHSTLEGISIVYKLFTLKFKYGVMPVFCRDRKEMTEYILHSYIAVGKERLRQKREAKRRMKDNPNTEAMPAELSSSGR